MTTEPEAPQNQKRRFQLGPRRIVALIAAALVILFVVQNRDRVSMHLFTIAISAPLWTALVVVAALGLVCGYLLKRGR